MKKVLGISLIVFLLSILLINFSSLSEGQHVRNTVKKFAKSIVQGDYEKVTSLMYFHEAFYSDGEGKSEFKELQVSENDAKLAWKKRMYLLKDDKERNYSIEILSLEDTGVSWHEEVPTGKVSFKVKLISNRLKVEKPIISVQDFNIFFKEIEQNKWKIYKVEADDKEWEGSVAMEQSLSGSITSYDVEKPK